MKLFWDVHIWNIYSFCFCSFRHYFWLLENLVLVITMTCYNSFETKIKISSSLWKYYVRIRHTSSVSSFKGKSVIPMYNLPADWLMDLHKLMHHFHHIIYHSDRALHHFAPDCLVWSIYITFVCNTIDTIPLCSELCITRLCSCTYQFITLLFSQILGVKAVLLSFTVTNCFHQTSMWSKILKPCHYYR